MMKLSDFADRLICAVCLVIAAIVIGSLFGCSREDYWQQAREPGPVHAVYVVPAPEVPCGRAVLGCYDTVNGLIWIKSGMSAELTRCVVRHEYRHAVGDDHPGFPEAQYAIQCGDGSIHPGLPA